MIELSQIGVALLNAVLGLFVLRARPRNAVNHAFAAQSLVFAGWILGVSGFQNLSNLALSFGFAFAFASLIPIAFLLFAHCYPSAASWSSPLYVRAVFLIGMLFTSLALFTDLIVYDAEITPTGLSRKAGPLLIVRRLFHSDMVFGRDHFRKEVALFSRARQSQISLSRSWSHWWIGLEGFRPTCLCLS